MKPAALLKFQGHPEVLSGQTTVIHVSTRERLSLLLAWLAGDPPPSRPGALMIRGQDAASLQAPEWISHLRKTAFLTSSGDLLENLRVWENLLLPTHEQSGPRGRTAQKALEEIETMLSHKPFHELSPASFLNALPYQLSFSGRIAAAALRAALQKPDLIVSVEQDLDQEELVPVKRWLAQILPDTGWLVLSSGERLHPDEGSVTLPS
jgi:ABC-type lipoprotein export system ATPase subunit